MRAQQDLSWKKKMGVKELYAMDMLGAQEA